MAPRPLTTLRRWWYTPRIRSNLITTVLAVGMLGLGVVVAAWTRACANSACPSIASLVREYDPAQASKVYAADGRLITDLGAERRTVVSLEQISPAAVAAFVVVEDKRF
ncbi:MAG: transglycosylase domain-containing protein [Gemmatimonadetes bacterium]|nr:transglycosylase domain-containing protein [Gemmatimonadota bacterium]